MRKSGWLSLFVMAQEKGPKLEGYSVVLDAEYCGKSIEEMSVKNTNQAEAILKDMLLLNLIDTLK